MGKLLWKWLLITKGHCCIHQCFINSMPWVTYYSVFNIYIIIFQCIGLQSILEFWKKYCLRQWNLETLCGWTGAVFTSRRLLWKQLLLQRWKNNIFSFLDFQSNYSLKEHAHPVMEVTIVQARIWLTRDHNVPLATTVAVNLQNQILSTRLMEISVLLVSFWFLLFQQFWCLWYWWKLFVMWLNLQISICNSIYFLRLLILIDSVKRTYSIFIVSRNDKHYIVLGFNLVGTIFCTISSTAKIYPLAVSQLCTL